MRICLVLSGENGRGSEEEGDLFSGERDENGLEAESDLGRTFAKTELQIRIRLPTAK
jgi:hypothetical protein